MLRIRETDTTPDRHAAASAQAGAAGPALLPIRSSRHRRPRQIAFGLLGLALGASGTIAAVGLVQAGDDAGVREFHRQEAEARQARRAPAGAGYAVSASAYAPASRSWNLPLFQTAPNGRIPQDIFGLNPFKPRHAAAPQPARHRVQHARHDIVSGAADVARTICVRMCDGFHAPIGHLRSIADLKAHEALCQANNPGIPVKVFRVPAGQQDIDGAVSQDGRTYGSLPVAYGHQSSGDPACRPAIVQANERRISLLRDFTLRPGDTVVLDGQARTFSGASHYPYVASDFRDFRAASALGSGERQRIDALLGVSHKEASLRAFRQSGRVREAALRDPDIGSDAAPALRGTLGPPVAAPVRVVEPSPFSR